MEQTNKLLAQIAKIQYRITSNNKKPRKFGTNHLLYHSEIHFINAISSYKGLNVSQLSEKLGVTKGAITQVAEKLLRKNLIYKYNKDSNKKEVYVKLTTEGRIAFENHKKFHSKLSHKISNYMNTLTDNQINAIFGLIDIIDENLEDINKEERI